MIENEFSNGFFAAMAVLFLATLLIVFGLSVGISLTSYDNFDIFPHKDYKNCVIFELDNITSIYCEIEVLNDRDK